jgi:hypothetical protein
VVATGQTDWVHKKEFIMSKARDEMAKKLRAHTKATEETFGKLGIEKPILLASEKDKTFLLSSRTFRLEAPTDWTDADAYAFLKKMDSMGVWEKMEGALKTSIDEVRCTLTKTLGDVSIVAKD